MKMMHTRLAISAIFVTGFACTALAAPSFHSTLRKAARAVLDEDTETKPSYEWSLPSIIQSGLVHRGISFFGGDTYANYRSRSFELRQEQVKVGITDEIEVFYGRQFALAKGLTTSRFYDDDDYYGARVVVKRPTETDSSAWSLQFEALRPGTAQVNTSNGSETFAGTADNTFSVNYGDRQLNQYQLSYTSVAAPAFYDAHAVSIGVGHDFAVGSGLVARLQATLVGQSFTADGASSNFELKSIGSGSIAWNATPWLAIEGNVTLLPNGMPYASGEFSAISGFAVYNPGGIVNDLRSDFVAFGSILMTAHWNF